MPETYVVTVKTEGGKSLVETKIGGDFFTLSFVFSRLSHAFLHRAEDIEKLKMELGSGTIQSAPPSQPPTES